MFLVLSFACTVSPPTTVQCGSDTATVPLAADSADTGDPAENAHAATCSTVRLLAGTQILTIDLTSDAANQVAGWAEHSGATVSLARIGGLWFWGDGDGIVYTGADGTLVTTGARADVFAADEHTWFAATGSNGRIRRFATFVDLLSGNSDLEIDATATALALDETALYATSGEGVAVYDRESGALRYTLAIDGAASAFGLAVEGSRIHILDPFFADTQYIRSYDAETAELLDTTPVPWGWSGGLWCE